MSVGEQIGAAILSGLIVWILKELVFHYRKSQNLRISLLDEINFFTKEMKQTVEYLERECREMKENQELEYGGYYSNHKPIFFREMIQTLSAYLNRKEFSKVTKAYRAIDEFHILVDGFFADTLCWKTEKRRLTKDEIALLNRKKDRIKSIYDVLSSQIENLNDLPDDYRGVINAQTVRR